MFSSIPYEQLVKRGALKIQRDTTVPTTKNPSESKPFWALNRIVNIVDREIVLNLSREKSVIQSLDIANEATQLSEDLLNCVFSAYSKHSYKSKEGEVIVKWDEMAKSSLFDEFRSKLSSLKWV